MSHITGILPDNLINCMSESQRKRLGKRGQTIKEAIEKATIEAEKDLHRQIVAYLEQHHKVKVGHARMDRKSTFTEGWPDLTFAVKGRAFALELKVGSNKPDPEQLACISDMLVDGWNVAVVRSLEEVKVLLEGMGLK